MKKIAIATISLLLGVGALLSFAEETAAPPTMAPPQKEHAWLDQLVGEWTTDVEIATAPGQAPQVIEGTESVRSIGGFWTVAESKGDMMGQPYTGISTLGYDVEKKKYVGTWVDSVNSHMWIYEGTVDETGKILTLETEGPCPMVPGKIFKFKEKIEIKSKDHKVFTSSMQLEDGSWITPMTVHSRRKS